MPDLGYAPEVVWTFLDSVGSVRDDDGYESINGKRVQESHRDSFERWAFKDVIPLGRLDQILMAYDLHLFELEMFAEEHFGTNGFIS